MTIEERIAHFLKLAQDSGSTQHERDVAAEQAERLMIKHGIDRLHLPTGEQPKEKIVTKPMFFGGAYAAERKDLAVQVVFALKMKCYKLTGVRGYDSITGKSAGGIKLTIVGFESDVEDAIRLIHSLDLQAAVAVKAWAKTQTPDWDWRGYSTANKTHARKSFLLAFGQGAAKRIKETRRQVVEEEVNASAGTALVLASREAQVNDFYDGLGLSRGRSRARTINSSAFSAGRTAGYNANTGSSALSGARAGITR
jgi:hypothetical protein